MLSIAHAGIDAHSKNLVVAVLVAGSDQPLRYEVANDEMEVKRLFGRLAQKYDLRCCYESGQGGYVLCRWLKSISVHCDVIASSKVPQMAGERIKTDKRDALKLARLYRAGELTAIHIPTTDDEAVRSLVRWRESLVCQASALKNQINKFLASRGRVWPGKSRWSLKHWTWLKKQSFSQEETYVWEDMLALLEYKLTRIKQADAMIAGSAQSERYKSHVDRLCCLRGVAVLTAMTVICEIIDFKRFKSAPALMAYLGLVPRENSSGQSRRQSGITKTGNSRCRRILVEAAGKYRHKPAVSAALRIRQQGQSAEVIAQAWKAQQRLYKKYWAVASKSGSSHKAVVAVARELSGFMWALMN